MIEPEQSLLAWLSEPVEMTFVREDLESPFIVVCYDPELGVDGGGLAPAHGPFESLADAMAYGDKWAAEANGLEPDTTAPFKAYVIPLRAPET